MRNKLSLIVALGFVAAPMAAQAVPVSVSVSADLAKDIFTPSFFGIVDPSVPIQINFDVDDAGVTTLPAGTPVHPASGFAFSTPAILAPTAAISNFSASIGIASFTGTDLLEQSLGTSSYSYSVLLLGSLTPNSVSAIQFNLANAFGNIQIGVVNCSPSCVVIDVGFGDSNVEGSVADISSIQTSVGAAPPTSVPEPSTFVLLGLGLAGLGVMRRKRAA